MVAANDDEDQQWYEKHKQKTLRKDDKWYPISTQWYNNWKRFANVSNDSDEVNDVEEKNLGKIDNSLILENGNLKSEVLEPDDFQLVHEDVFHFLRKKYGIVSPEHAMARKVIQLKGQRNNDRLIVEVFLLRLTFRMPQRASYKPFSLELSKSDTGQVVIHKVKEQLQEDKFRLHLEVGSGEFVLLSAESSLNEECTKRTMNVEIEFPDQDGKWSRDKKIRRENGATGGQATSSTNYYQSGSHYAYSSKPRSYVSNPGLRGLNNLGNTCFMNSAIQCLSNVPSLTSYFRNNDWRNVINYDNPLGMNGEIAESYADLIENLWCEGGASTFMPRRFKMAVGKFAPQFSGFQQQDAQELMAFLLDGLHEDLNRIKKKPYVETKDYDEKSPDEKVAQESWENYRKRNDSVIVDLFHGQLRSELHCPECNRLSVTFDPFCYLSLPLPPEEMSVHITLIPTNRSSRSHAAVPIKYTLRVNGDISYKELLKRFRETAELHDKPLILSDCNPQTASLRNLPPSYLINDIGSSSPLDHSSVRSNVFYAFELSEKSQDQCTPHLIRIDFVDDRHSPSRTRPWLVTLEKGSNDPSPTSEVPRKIFDALLKDEQFLKFFPTLKKLANNSSSEINNAAHNDGLGEDPRVEDDAGPMDVDNDAEELEKLFDMKINRNYRYLEIMEAKLKVAVQPDFFEVREDKSVSQFQGMGRGVYLENCLDLFTKKEKLGERDSWYCNKCKKHQRATKKFDLWKLPDTLVIHIKRFGNANRLWRNKLNTKVFFPLEDMNITNWVKNKTENYAYNLVSVVNHYGSMGGGHYTGFARNKDDNAWYNFDDSSVSSTNADAVVTQNAYVLVYVRQKSAKVPRSSAETVDLMETE